MNLEVMRKYISEYEKQFADINNKELYKWRAVKQFQDHWNPNVDDFAKMLSLSLSRTRNLLAAADYWPERMIIANAEKSPDVVRELLSELFNEEDNVLERILAFQVGMQALNSRNFPGRKHYQDHRAILVFLNLRYPDIYYFYKFKMFKTFCEKVDHDHKPQRGSISNITEYFSLCDIIRDEIRLNNNLLKLHKDRIGKNEYFDAEYNILTQDFIFAVTDPLPHPVC
jgi:hypothetical protein